MPSAGRRHNNGGGGGGRGGGRNTQLPAMEKDKLHRQISLLQAAVKHKWVVGGFCSSHGHGVSSDHDSAKCRGQRQGHDPTANRARPVGPGAKRNKGWDDWILNPPLLTSQAAG